MGDYFLHLASRVAIGVIATICLVGPVRSADTALTPVAQVEGITEYQLDNGLRVLLFPDKSKQQITVNITYFVGSRHEGYGETGMAHLLEHMLFQGTPDHPDIPQELTDHGAEPNGTTWTDRTNYFETFKATRENLAWALDLEADRMINSEITEEDLDSEMTVVRNEWEAGENRPFGVLLKRALSVAYQWHNYGNSTIGARSDIENVPVPRLRSFYEKYYQPDNALLVIAGNFDTDEALPLVQDKFGNIPKPEREGNMRLYETYTREPAQDGERTVTLRRVGDVQHAMAVYHMPPGTHEDFAAVDVLAHILADKPSGRLYKTLVESGKAADVHAFAFQWKEPSALIVDAEVREAKPLAPARKTLFDTVEGIAADPPTETEVMRARNELLKRMDQTFKDTERIARYLSEWAAMGDWRMFFIHRDRIEDVTPEDVQRVAERYLLPSNRTLARFLPTDDVPPRAEIPEAPDVAALTADYEGGEAVAAGEQFDPTPVAIEQRTERIELDSGFELALLPKQNRGDTVVARLTLRHGTEDTLRGRATAGEMLGAMLMRGTEERSRQEIQDALDRWKSDLALQGAPGILTARIESDREHLPKVLKLLGEILRRPAFADKQWQLLKEERLAELEQRRSRPNSRAFIAFNRALEDWPSDHPEYTPTVEESIERSESVTLAEVREYYAQLLGADGGTMAIVGDFDVAKAKDIVETSFGDWRANVAYERYPRPYRETDGSEQVIEIPDKRNVWLITGSMLNVRDDDPDYPKLVMGNYMLGGGFLASRLAKRIREKEGLSYGVGSFMSVHGIDRRGELIAYAFSAPENAQAVQEALFEEIDKVLTEGFTAEELAKAKQGWLDRQKVRRSEDARLARVLSNTLFYDRTMAHTRRVEQAIAELEVDAVNRAMREHLDPEDFVVVKAGDLGAAGSGEAATQTGDDE